VDLIEARQLASRVTVNLGSERVRVEEALGRIIAESVVAGRNLPAEDRSHLDGYALCHADTHVATLERPIAIKIVHGRIAAGHDAAVHIHSGECVRILTGAPLPRSADAVAPQEEVVVEGENLILRRPYSRGNGVMPSGEDVRKDELVLSRGEVLTPTRLAFVVALGYETVVVFQQPHVALLATGDEVRALGKGEAGPFTYCNNLYLLSWLTMIQGGKPHVLGVAGDEPSLIADLLRGAEANLVITTGGTGKGDRDFIFEVWKLLGIETLFNGINLTPGKNTALGVKDGKVFLAVPGNPWAAQIVFEQLAVPMLRRWQGLEEPSNAMITAKLKETVKHKPGFYKAVRGTLSLESVPPRFSPAQTKSTSVFNRIRDSFAYVILAPHVVEVAEGDKVEVHLVDFPMLASPLFRKSASVQG
jgi:molybdenum cofactor synthesis domain-containing protein